MKPYTLIKIGKTGNIGVALLGLGLWLSATGQTPQGDLYHQGEDVTGISQQTETTPADDSVLREPPAQISLAFPYGVRLVKLTLRNELRDWVDISFRYDPMVREEFHWDIPPLNAATYYTADWAILAENDRLVRGTFSFSFGPDAEAPSVTKAAEEALVNSRISGDPNTRFVTPPRTNIILNQDQPRYDPPFTIKLDDQGRVQQDQDSTNSPQ